MTGQTPIMMCLGSKVNNFKIFKLLLDHGANVYTKNYFGATMVHQAALCGQLEILRFLLENYKFDLNMKDNKGFMPVDYFESRFSRYSKTLQIQEGQTDK